MNELIGAIQELGNISWLDYVQLIATVVSIIISAMAVFYAVKIPKKIAEEQNKIALFEKRHLFYLTLCKCISFFDGIEETQSKTNVEIRRLFFIMLGDSGDCSEDNINENLTPLQFKVIGILNQGAFLFPIDMEKNIETFSKDLVNILSYTNTPETIIELYEKLKASSDIVRTNLINEIEKVLNLNK